jgi:hypothetical protein
MDQDPQGEARGEPETGSPEQTPDAEQSPTAPSQPGRSGSEQAEGDDHGGQHGAGGEGPSPRTVNRAIVAGAVFAALGFVATVAGILVGISQH